MAYCGTDAVREQLCGVDLAPLGDAAAREAALAAMVAGASSEVDLRCRRSFTPPTAAAERLFDGEGRRLLPVPDMVRLESVRIGGVEARPAHAYPIAGPPFRWIATGGRFPSGRQNVAVTAWWGFGEAVPNDIVRATACLSAAEALERLQAARSGGVQVQMAGQAREEFPAGGPYADRVATLRRHADRLLLPYRRVVVA